MDLYNNNNSSNEKKFGGPFTGILLAFLGAIAVGFNIAIIYSSHRYYPKIMGIGFIILYFGIAILIAPGKEESEGASSLGEAFGEASGITKAIWIIYAVAGLCVGIYVMASDTWLYCKFIAGVSAAISAVLFLIKYVYFLCRKPKLDQYGEVVVESSNYYHPSKTASAVCMILAAAAVILTVRYSYSQVYYDYGYTDSIISNTDEEMTSDAANEYISGLIDTKVPVRMVQYDSKQSILVVDMPSADDGLVNGCVIPFEHVIRACKDFKDYDFSEIYFIDEDKNIDFSISGKKFRKLKCIKKALRFMNSSSSTFNVFQFVDEDKCWLAQDENLESLVIYNLPEYDHEYVMTWNLEGFTEYYNTFIAGENEACSSLEILTKFREFYDFPEDLQCEFFHSYFFITTLQDYREKFFDDESELGIMFDFGTSDKQPIRNAYACNWFNSDEGSEDSEAADQSDSDDESESADNVM